MGQTEYETETEALQLYAVLEQLALSLGIPPPSTATVSLPLLDFDSAAGIKGSELAEAFKDIAKAICRNELLRRKLGVIPATIPLITRILACISNSIMAIFYSLDSITEATCVGYTSWKSAQDISNLATSVFQILRNLCAAVPENQILACKASAYVSIERILNHLCSWIKLNKSRSCPDIKMLVFASIHMGIQTLGNMMTSNPAVQNKLWPRFFGDAEFFTTLFAVNDSRTKKYVLLCVYNCVFNDVARSSLLLDTAEGRKLLAAFFIQILSPPINDNESPDIIHAIFKSIISLHSAKVVWRAVNRPSELQSISLDSRAEVLHLSSLPLVKVAFLRLIAYDSDVEQLDQSLYDSSFALGLVEDLKSAVQEFAKLRVRGMEAASGFGEDLRAIRDMFWYFARVTDGGSALSAAMREVLSAEGLIEPVIQFLGVAQELQPVVGIDGQRGAVDDGIVVVREGLYMMKADAIQVLSNLAYGCKNAQEKIRIAGGIPLILNHCHIDESNPFIKERSVFAIRNLCEGNAENQALIASMEAVGLPAGQNEALAAGHRMTAQLGKNGKIRIRAVDED
ncbi:hypothetical protein HDU84_004200 [Entophlyctis sp. JEL0112]|nr:hypothetical protein HDU84_004200 [Entophlyctis sp. JEL0112]